MKHVAIIGSTGSIGTQKLEIARWNQDIKICALSAHPCQIRHGYPYPSDDLPVIAGKHT